MLVNIIIEMKTEYNRRIYDLESQKHQSVQEKEQLAKEIKQNSELERGRRQTLTNELQKSKC